MHDFMTAERQREIVVEFERIQLIRKRAKTTLSNCTYCGHKSDLVGIDAAAELFDITTAELKAFVLANNVHCAAESQLCLTSLLAVMNDRKKLGEIRMIGDGLVPNN